MLLMDLIALSVKLGRRLNVVSVDASRSPVEALRELDVLSASAEESLAVQREVRNSSQHVYVELTVSSLRRAVMLQIETSARMIHGVTTWVDLLDPAQNGEQ
jgi:hypothetical protein